MLLSSIMNYDFLSANLFKLKERKLQISGLKYNITQKTLINQLNQLHNGSFITAI